MKAQVNFPQVIERGCGMDVHRDTVVVTVMGVGITVETRSFTTYTNSLRSLRDWLISLNITHMAIESTGIYWKPVYNILEQDFEVILVNARHVKNVPGHKTDKKDSRWLAKLLISGLLKASFIPPKDIRDMRDLTRYRKKLVQNAAADRNRFEKILQDANFKLSNVISDIFGKSGTLLINALIDGVDDFNLLLSLCHGRIKKKREILYESLQGVLTDNHKYMLNAIRTNLYNTLSKIESVDNQLLQLSKPYDIELELLKTMPGLNQISATMLLSEIGVDMSRFPTVNHLASWAGICPGNNESAGKSRSSRTNQGNQYIKPILVECAWAASHVKNSYLKKKYESLIGRRGKKRALIAVGHKMLNAAYYIIRDKVPYQDLGYEYLDSRKKQKQIQSYIDKLKDLGIYIEIPNIQ
ncbi:IS110 family transposase [Flavobacterium sp. AG291]|uniref:IS110 family transposase n=1 Tax=Flavobacterium sp. AG291 TaxID=2184000 RepID=UPI000E0AEF63|nr:IS110 family transposase [Flavobacterium sp. AG291]RDI03955.1 transposase [Flavobacterium sp. AG291]